MKEDVQSTFYFQKIHHIQVACPPACEEQARRFYGDVLQMQEISKPAILAARGGVWFQHGKVQIHIGVERDFSPAIKAHPAFLISNLQLLKSRLEKNGILVICDEELPGFKRFYTLDPFGNRLEFLEPLPEIKT